MLVVQVRGHFSSFALESGVRFQPSACPMIACLRFPELLFVVAPLPARASMNSLLTGRYGREAPRTVYRYEPIGTSTSTVSPTHLANRARPSGASTEMRWYSTGASTACTRA